jgi:hypothetical protein
LGRLPGRSAPRGLSDAAHTHRAQCFSRSGGIGRAAPAGATVDLGQTEPTDTARGRPSDRSRRLGSGTGPWSRDYPPTQPQLAPPQAVSHVVTGLRQLQHPSPELLRIDTPGPVLELRHHVKDRRHSLSTNTWAQRDACSHFIGKRASPDGLRYAWLHSALPLPAPGVDAAATRACARRGRATA